MYPLQLVLQTTYLPLPLSILHCGSVHAGTNIHEAWAWSVQHPQQTAEIVSNAMKFARDHFSEKGQLCYVVRLLHEYSKLLKNRNQLPELLHFQRKSQPDKFVTP